MEDTILENCPECAGRGTVKTQYGLIAICPTCGGECQIVHECGDEPHD